MLIQDFSTTRLKICIEVLKPYRIARFSKSTPNRKGKGRISIAPLWLLMALEVLKHSLDITWRQYDQALQRLENSNVLKRYGAVKSPSKSTLHNAWDNAIIKPLKEILIEIGWKIARKLKSFAIDITRF